MLVFDAHLDLSLNALQYNRDLRLTVPEIRAGEIGMSDLAGRGCGTVAFPEIFTDGKGGVNEERTYKLTKGDFYSTKFLNHDKRYSKNSDYLFVAQQHVERSLLESNISISAQKGKVTKGMVIQCLKLENYE